MARPSAREDGSGMLSVLIGLRVTSKKRHGPGQPGGALRFGSMLRVAHPVMRSSMRLATTYMAMPMKAVTRRPAKTRGTSKRDDAAIIMWPMPAFAATVSAMMEPTNATVMAIFRDAKKYGIERGSPTLRMMSRFFAPSARSTSRNSGSTVAMPVATFTRIGKKEIRNALMIAGTVPMPNQITSTGTTATLGIELKPIRIG